MDLNQPCHRLSWGRQALSLIRWPTSAPAHRHVLVTAPHNIVQSHDLSTRAWPFD